MSGGCRGAASALSHQLEMMGGGGQTAPCPFLGRDLFADREMGWGRLPWGPVLRWQPPAPGHFQATPQEDVENPPVVLGEPEKQQRVQQLVSPSRDQGLEETCCGQLCVLT